MSEPRDDTPAQPPTESHTPRNPEPKPPRNYYDDDATGYELYDPQADDEQTNDDAPNRAE